MAQGLNKVMLIGNLGADPEVRFTQAGSAVMNLRLAVNESWFDKESGERKERVEWCAVVMFGKRAEALSRHLRKGQSIYVEGRIQTRKWQDKEGRDRYTTEIVANDLLFLGGKGDSPAPARDAAPPDDGFGGEDDDIPFRCVDERLS